MPLRTSCTQVVEQCLKDIPYTRDDDTLLYYHFLERKCGVDVEKMTGLQLLKAIKNDVFPSPQLITRVRAKLQEHNASLRGKLWEQRHKLGNRIRKEIPGQ